MWIYSELLTLHHWRRRQYGLRIYFIFLNWTNLNVLSVLPCYIPGGVVMQGICIIMEKIRTCKVTAERLWVEGWRHERMVNVVDGWWMRKQQRKKASSQIEGSYFLYDFSEYLIIYRKYLLKMFSSMATIKPCHLSWQSLTSDNRNFCHPLRCWECYKKTSLCSKHFQWKPWPRCLSLG